MNILIFGPQGSGKSTQAKLLAKHLGVPLLDIGDFLRDKAKEKTSQARVIQEAIQKGELVDEEQVIKLVQKELEDEKYKRGVVMDGAARTLRQATSLLSTIDKAFFLDISDEEAKQRLAARGRPDDTPEIIVRRLALYHEQVDPVLAYFAQNGLLEKVDATKSIEEVTKDILARLPKSND